MPGALLLTNIPMLTQSRNLRNGKIDKVLPQPLILTFILAGSQRMPGARLLTSVPMLTQSRNLRNGKKGSSLNDTSYS